MKRIESLQEIRKEGRAQLETDRKFWGSMYEFRKYVGGRREYWNLRVETTRRFTKRRDDRGRRGAPNDLSFH